MFSPLPSMTLALGDILGSNLGGATDVWWIEPRDAAEHPKQTGQSLRQLPGKMSVEPRLQKPQFTPQSVNN